MNEKTTYIWTEELGRSAILADFTTKTARLWVMASGGAILAIYGMCSCLANRDPVSLLIGLFGLFIMYAPIGVCFICYRAVKNVGKLISDPKITVLLTDSTLTISSDQSTRTIEWNKVTRVLDKRGFLLLYEGNLLLACLPKQSFSASQIEFIFSKNRKVET